MSEFNKPGQDQVDKHPDKEKVDNLAMSKAMILKKAQVTGFEIDENHMTNDGLDANKAILLIQKIMASQISDQESFEYVISYLNRKKEAENFEALRQQIIDATSIHNIELDEGYVSQEKISDEVGSTLINKALTNAPNMSQREFEQAILYLNEQIAGGGKSEEMATQVDDNFVDTEVNTEYKLEANKGESKTREIWREAVISLREIFAEKDFNLFFRKEMDEMLESMNKYDSAGAAIRDCRDFLNKLLISDKTRSIHKTELDKFNGVLDDKSKELLGNNFLEKEIRAKYKFLDHKIVEEGPVSVTVGAKLNSDFSPTLAVQTEELSKLDKLYENEIRAKQKAEEKKNEREATIQETKLGDEDLEQAKREIEKISQSVESIMDGFGDIGRKFKAEYNKEWADSLSNGLLGNRVSVCNRKKSKLSDALKEKGFVSQLEMDELKEAVDSANQYLNEMWGDEEFNKLSRKEHINIMELEPEEAKKYDFEFIEFTGGVEDLAGLDKGVYEIERVPGFKNEQGKIIYSGKGLKYENHVVSLKKPVIRVVDGVFGEEKDVKDGGKFETDQGAGL